jgi:flavodoxin
MIALSCYPFIIYYKYDNEWEEIMKKSMIVLTIIIFIFTVSLSFAGEQAAGEILILYYSKTGKTKVACEALKRALGADIVEIKGVKDKIEPEHPDVSSYPFIILGSPIWMARLSAPMRTLIAKNRFDGKKVVIFTTANSFGKVYEENSKPPVTAAGGKVVGYYLVLSKDTVNNELVDRTDIQIVGDTLKLVPEIKKCFSSLP